MIYTCPKVGVSAVYATYMYYNMHDPYVLVGFFPESILFWVNQYDFNRTGEISKTFLLYL